MKSAQTALNTIDNGGRRSGIDRRRFSYVLHIPERRGGDDRRDDLDRRCGEERRDIEDRRIGIDRRTDRKPAEVIDLRSYKDRRSSEDRRRGKDRRKFMNI